MQVIQINSNTIPIQFIGDILFLTKKNMRFFILVVISLSLYSCNSNSSQDYDSSLPKAVTIPAPTPIIFKVINVYPHDSSSFTQGLEFYNGKLYEGTGEYKQSKLRIVDLKTGIAEKSHTLSDTSLFGEGITILNGKIYQLTWQNNKIFEYNLNDISKPVRTFIWNHEGWGATNNGKELIISDGTPNLYFVTPDNSTGQMIINKTISVRDDKGLVDKLNELELINGYVFANRWLTNDILKIDTANGHVVGRMDMSGLIQQYDPQAVLDDGAVLNGIAYDSTLKRLFITGKDWPRLFEIELR